METFQLILKTLVANIIKLVVMPILGMATIYYMTMDQPRKYQSDSRVFLNLQENTSISLSEQDVKSYEIHTYFENLRELAFSRNTLEYVRVLVFKDILEGETDLFPLVPPDVWERKEELIKLIDHKIENQEAYFDILDSLENKVVNYLDFAGVSLLGLSEGISMNRLNESYYMNVSVTTENPYRSYYLGHVFIRAILHINKSLSRNKIREHRMMIEKLLEEAKKELDIRIAMLEEYKIKYNIINLPEHTKAIVGYIVDLEREKAQLISTVETSDKNRENVLSKLLQKGGIAMDFSSHNEILDLQKQYEKMHNKAQFASLEQNNFGGVRDELRTKIKSIVNSASYDPSLVNLDLVTRYLDYDLMHQSSKNELSAMENEISRVMKYAKQFAPHEGVISTMNHEIETARKTYLLLLNKLNLTQSLEHGENGDLQVIDRPEFPTKPLPSKRAILIVAGGVGIFVFLAGLLIIISLLNSSINTVQRFIQVFETEVKAGLPMKPKKKNMMKGYELIKRQQENNLHRSLAQSRARSILVVGNKVEDKAQEAALVAQRKLQDQGLTVRLIDTDWVRNYDWGDHPVERITKEQAQEMMDDTGKMQEYLDHYTDDRVLIVAPPANKSIDFKNWLDEADKALYSFGTGRISAKPDFTVLNYLRRNNKLIGAVMNDVDLENMTDIIGEVPRPRSFVRRKVKAVMNRQFALFSI